MGRGKVYRERRFSDGNAALLVVVDSAGCWWDHQMVEPTILVALEHFGMPYRLLDLARQRPTAEALADCAAIVLAQCRLGESLTEVEEGLISQAVERGVGLINFDSDLRAYGPAMREIFGFERINPRCYATNIIRICDIPSYIVGCQSPGRFHTLDRMVTAISVEKWRNDVAVLAEGILGKDQLVYTRHLTPGNAFEPRNHPLLFATRWGRGRAVQFTLNARVWRNEFYGHARDLDDVFWRSIVWAARKPFASTIIPPFVTLSLDDCRGLHDFKYLDIANKHGFIPMPSLFIADVPKRLYPKIREGQLSGKAAYNTHSLSYYDLLTYNFGRGECSADELKRNFQAHDDFWAEIGAKPTETVRMHWGEYGVKALPMLKQRGCSYFCPILQPGLMKADMCLADGYWPYNLQTCYYDYLPEDNDFFAFAAMQGRGREDFLTGSTPNLRENERVDVDKAAESAAGQIMHGLRNGFQAEIVTHEQKLMDMSLDQWDAIVGRAVQLTEGQEKVFASHDEIAHYLKGRDGTFIGEATADGDAVRCTLAGQSDVALKVSVFRNVDDGVEREYVSFGDENSKERL